jgi:hypothetical protein
MGRPLIAVCVCLTSLLACGSDDEPDMADAGGQFEQSYCPPADHPRVHYVSADLAECQTVVLDCTLDQTGFDNTCGCGCIDKGDAICPEVFDPAVTWVSIDPAECDGPPQCALGDTPFSNSCGCGCIRH